MRRAGVAVAWILGTTLPVLIATVGLVGCCVLPFHRVAHKVLMPICHVAANLAGDSDDRDAVPPRAKEEPAKRFVTDMTNVYRLRVPSLPHDVAAPVAATAYRSFIALGAVRCDQDVGLHVLVETFLI
jgi:hypothetical protein